MGNVKVVIGIPHLGDIPGYFLDSVVGLSAPPGSWVTRAEHMPVDVARNTIVKAALSDPEMTHLFFMDADMQFPSDALLRLVERDVDVIGGTYFARTESPHPHTYKFHHEDTDEGCPLGWTENHDRGRYYQPLVKQFAKYLKRHKKFADLAGAIVLPDSKDAVVKADALGTGCMLIKRGVLEAVGYPWFRCHDLSGGGEDFFFCDRAKELGFGIYGDFSVQCQHEYRHIWMERQDFARRFHVGQEDEYDWDALPVIVDVAPKKKSK